MRSTLSRADRVFQLRFAIRISKGITLSLLLSYSVVKEPTSAKGRQSCQTLTSVSSGLVSLPVKPTRLTRTRLPLRIAAGKDLRANCCFCRLQGPGIVCSRAAPLSTTASIAHNSVTPSLFHAAKIIHNSLAAPRYSSSPLHNLLCRFELSSVFQRSRTAQGPARTTLPQVLFHRFR